MNSTKIDDGEVQGLYESLMRERLQPHADVALAFIPCRKLGADHWR
jgi:hypothetical protein